MSLTEQTDPYTIAAADADALLAGAPWRRLAVLGDSIAEGLGEPSGGYETASWAERLRAALARQSPDVAYLNLGQRDLRAAEVRDKQLPAAVEFRPDLVVLCAGGNDLFVQQFDPDAVQAVLEDIVGTLRGAGATVVIMTLMDIVKAVPQLAGGAMDRLPVLNDRMKAAAATHGGLVLDSFAHPMCADRDVYSQDLKHATMRGHAILAAELIRLLGAQLRTG